MLGFPFAFYFELRGDPFFIRKYDIRQTEKRVDERTIFLNSDVKF